MLISELIGSVRSLLDGGRGSVLAAVAAGWFLTIGVRMIYPVLLPDLRAAYGLDLTAAGLLLTVLFVAYAAGQLPGGMLSDRFGERRILTISLLLAAGTVALVVTAPSTLVVFVATALFGFATALYAVARYTVLASLYPERLGAANGLVAASMDAGQAVLPPIAGLLAVALLWQAGFAFTIPLFVLASIALWFAVPRRTDASTPDPTSSIRIRDAVAQLRSPTILRGTLLYLFGLSIWQAFTGFYPTFLIEVKGLSTTAAGVLVGGFFALGVLVKPLAGSAYDRFGLRQSFSVLALACAFALVTIPVTDSIVALAVLTALASALLGFSPIVEAYVIAALPEEVQGTGFGALRTIAFTVGATSPVAFGAAADRGYFAEAFFGLAAIAGLCVLLAVRAPVE